MLPLLTVHPSSKGRCTLAFELASFCSNWLCSLASLRELASFARLAPCEPARLLPTLVVEASNKKRGSSQRGKNKKIMRKIISKSNK